MVGVSGTGKSGKLHYYYICQKRRMEKSCDKSTVRRDSIEREVAAAIRDYIMRDDVLEWIADSAMNFAKEYRAQTCVGTLEAQLADNKRATKNLLTAIEQGIITPTTKERLLELEREQAVLVSRLDEEKASLLNYSRDDIISAMSLYRNGDVENKAYQAKLFDAFLVAVYLYDDHFKLEFNVTGKKNFVDVPLDASLVDSVENNAPEGCSYKVSLGPPKGYYTNLFTLSAALPSQYGSSNTDRNERIFSLVESVRSFFMSCGLSTDCPWTICGQSQNAAIFTYRSVRFSQFLIADTDCPSVIGFLFLAVSS